MEWDTKKREAQQINACHAGPFPAFFEDAEDELEDGEFEVPLEEKVETPLVFSLDWGWVKFSNPDLALESTPYLLYSGWDYDRSATGSEMGNSVSFGCQIHM